MRFRTQVVVGRFIVDFLCPARALAVEVDGGVHDARADIDAQRDAMLQSSGLRVLHVRNEDVFDDIDGVLSAILVALDG